MTTQPSRVGRRTARAFSFPRTALELLEPRRLLAGGSVGPAPSPADPVPVDAANFGVKARSHTSGSGVPLVLVHGNNAEDDAASDYRWDGFLGYVDAHPADFSQFDIWIWVHDTSLPVGFNGAQNSQADLLSRFVYEDLQLGVPGSAYEDDQVALLAHSQGGIVSRSFMNRLKSGTSRLQGEDVSGLVTLGTPHHGSPFAVMDWVAALWANVAGTTLADEIVFNQIKNSGVQPDRPGSVNLAWDNADGAIQGSLVTRFPFSSYTLTAADANDLPAPVADPTRYYPQSLKEQYGTLAQLNAAEAFHEKIIAVGAYDSSLADNPDTDSEVIAALMSGDEHQQLAAVTAMMALISAPQTGSANGSSYFANDGLVPLQSALLLDVAGNGGNFAARGPNSDVTPNAPLIASTAPDGQHYRIYTDPVRDHLDLLATTHQPYWDALTADLRSFIDTTAPAVSSSSFEHHPPHRVRFTFSEDVFASLAAGDLVIVNDITQAAVPASGVAYDPQSNRATFSIAAPLPDGNYTATLAASAVEDQSGNTLVQNVVLRFFVLGGDADRDRTVGFSDLVAVAQNYGATGKAWAQGDFTGEGDVNFQDLVILAQRYGTTLPPTPPADPVPASATSRRRQAEKVFSVQPVAQPRPQPTRPALHSKS